MYDDIWLWSLSSNKPFSTFNSNIDEQPIQMKLNHHLHGISVRAVFLKFLHTSATAKCRASSSKRIANGGPPGRDPNPTGRRPHNLQGIMILLGNQMVRNTPETLSVVLLQNLFKKKNDLPEATFSACTICTQLEQIDMCLIIKKYKAFQLRSVSEFGSFKGWELRM